MSNQEYKTELENSINENLTIVYRSIAELLNSDIESVLQVKIISDNKEFIDASEHIFDYIDMLVLMFQDANEHMHFSLDQKIYECKEQLEFMKEDLADQIDFNTNENKIIEAKYIEALDNLHSDLAEYVDLVQNENDENDDLESQE